MYITWKKISWITRKNKKKDPQTWWSAPFYITQVSIATIVTDHRSMDRAFVRMEHSFVGCLSTMLKYHWKEVQLIHKHFEHKWTTQREKLSDLDCTFGRRLNVVLHSSKRQTKKYPKFISRRKSHEKGTICFIACNIECTFLISQIFVFLYDFLPSCIQFVFRSFPQKWY